MGRAPIRVVIPINPQKMTLLADQIIAKDLSDGINDSPLSILNMSDMRVKNTLAKEQDLIAGKASRDKETAFYERDFALGIAKGQECGMPGTVDFYLKAVRNILLGYYKGSEPLLGDWGYEVGRGGGGIAIMIPKNAVKLIALAKLVIAKNTAEGANSIIKGINIVDFTAKTNYADEQHLLATKLNRDRETATTARDVALGVFKGMNLTNKETVRYYITQVRDVLLGLYKGHESLLGDWGFVVHHSHAPKHVKDLNLPETDEDDHKSSNE